jgi:sugar phosphate isomerase/epimerase
MKLGVITNGISQDLEHSLKVLKKHGIDYAEFQFVWDTEIGSHSDEDNQKMKDLLNKYGIKVCCITRHNFAGLHVMATEVDDEAYKSHLDHLKRTIELGKFFGTKNIRTMTFNTIPVIFGSNGGEQWVAGNNKAWGKLLKLFEKPVQLAEDSGIDLVMENGTNAMITSGWLARKLIDDLGTKHLKVLWDPGNSLFHADVPYPDAYDEIKDFIGHVHVKDIKVDLKRASIQFRQMGRGQMAQYFTDIADALRRDGYDGVVSYESVYRPEGGTFEDGFNASVDAFKEIFG